MDYIFFIHSINFVHKSLHYWTRDYFKNNRRSLLMKTKSTIKLFATAILATATINAVNVATHPSDIFASEVTQIPNKYNVGTRTTFETDPVFKNYEDAEKYLESYVKPTIEKSRYGYFTATVLPDGLGGKYLVSGFIDSHSEDEEMIKGNKETAQKIVKNAGIDLTNLTNQSNGVLTGKITETQRDGFPSVTFETDPVFKTFDEANSYAEGHGAEILDATKGYKDYSLRAEPALNGTSNYLVSGEIRAYKNYSGDSISAEEAKKNIEAAARKVVNDANLSIPTTKPVTPAKPVEEVKPETPTKPAEDVKPETPAKPVEEVKPATPTKPVEEVKPETPAKPVEDIKPETPTKPVEEVKSETPTKPVEEVKPETPAKPAEEVKPETPTKPVEDVKPETPAKPVEDVKPETPTKPVEEVKPETPAKPVEDVKPETPAKPVEDVKPKTPTKPVEEVKPETPTKPVEEVKPETPTTPEKDVKSETPAKPENNKNNDKKTLPNTGESTSILGIIGTVLSITGLGFIVKRKRG